jgi:hypothetical protein
MVPVDRQNYSGRMRQRQHRHYTERSVRTGCTGDVTAHQPLLHSFQSKATARKVTFASLWTDGSTRRAFQTTRSVEKLMHAPSATPTSVVNVASQRYIICTNNMPARVSGSTPSGPAEPAVLTTPHSSTTTSQPQAKDNTKNRDPLTVLSKLLSSSNLPSPQPTDTLRTLYTSIKRRSQLRRLTSKQLTEFLSLIGSLSLPAPRAPCIYLSKLISRIVEPSFQTHWPFVMEISRDKEQLGYALSGTDRYWIMRAQLAKVVVAEGENLRSGECVSREPQVIMSNVQQVIHGFTLFHKQIINISEYGATPLIQRSTSHIFIPYFPFTHLIIFRSWLSVCARFWNCMPTPIPGFSTSCGRF